MSVITPGIELFHGNTRWLNLRLRRYGQREAMDVSTAQRIAVEFAKIGEAPLPPVYASRTAPGADWIGGRVPVLVSPADVTARIGSYDVSVTVFETPVERTAAVGRVEVLPRPVRGLLTLPNGNAYASSNVMAMVNAGAYTIPMGAPVAATGGGLVLAQGAGPARPADGIAVAPTGPGSTCLYIASGQVRLVDWTPVFGSGSLPAGAAELWLGAAAGSLTDTIPVAPAFALRQVVGDVGSDPQVLNVNISSGFVL